MQITQSKGFASAKGLTFFQRHAHKWMYGGLLISDLLALSFALAISVLIREYFLDSASVWNVFQSLLPGLLFIAILIYTFQGQYALGGTNPVSELRSLSLGTCLAFLLLTAFTFFTQTSLQYSRFIFILAWILTLLLVPTFRFILRICSVRLNIWGEPVIVLGSGPTTHALVNNILKKSQLSWRPIAIIGPQTIHQPQKAKIASFNVQREDQLEKLIKLYKTIIPLSTSAPSLKPSSLISPKGTIL